MSWGGFVPVDGVVRLSFDWCLDHSRWRYEDGGDAWEAAREAAELLGEAAGDLPVSRWEGDEFAELLRDAAREAFQVAREASDDAVCAAAFRRGDLLEGLADRVRVSDWSAGDDANDAWDAFCDGVFEAAMGWTAEFGPAFLGFGDVREGAVDVAAEWLDDPEALGDRVSVEFSPGLVEFDCSGRRLGFEIRTATTPEAREVLFRLVEDGSELSVEELVAAAEALV